MNQMPQQWPLLCVRVRSYSKWHKNPTCWSKALCVKTENKNSTGPQKNKNKQFLRPRKETGWEAQAGVLRQPEESVQTRRTNDVGFNTNTWNLGSASHLSCGSVNCAEARENSRGVMVARWSATVSFFQNKKEKACIKNTFMKRSLQTKQEREDAEHRQLRLAQVQTAIRIQCGTRWEGPRPGRPRDRKWHLYSG